MSNSHEGYEIATTRIPTVLQVFTRSSLSLNTFRDFLDNEMLSCFSSICDLVQSPICKPNLFPYIVTYSTSQLIMVSCTGRVCTCLQE